MIKVGVLISGGHVVLCERLSQKKKDRTWTGLVSVEVSCRPAAPTHT